MRYTTHMSSEDDTTEIDVLSKHVSSYDDIFGTTEDTVDVPPADEYFNVPDTTPNPSAAMPTVKAGAQTVNDITIPDMDEFLDTERRLYERALSVYEHVLDTGNDKARLAAAKDLVSIYTTRRNEAIKAANRTETPTTNNHLHISVDSVKNALKAALSGMEGGVQQKGPYGEHRERTVNERPTFPAPGQGDDE